MRTIRACAGAVAMLAFATLASGQADARAAGHRRHHRQRVAPAFVEPDELPPANPRAADPLAATGIAPAPGIGVGTGIAFGLTPGALVAGATASSYTNGFYGYGTYYAPSLVESAGQPGYGDFGY